MLMNSDDDSNTGKKYMEIRAHLKKVLISTVDSFQGGERDIIILSLVRENSSSFLQDSKRINVALTRAKHHLIIVGSGTVRLKGLWKRVCEEFSCLIATPSDLYTILNNS